MVRLGQCAGCQVVSLVLLARQAVQVTVQPLALAYVPNGRDMRMKLADAAMYLDAKEASSGLSNTQGEAREDAAYSA